MPDPEIVSRAHRAAATLEQAWERWRVRHGLSPGPMPPVSSYVGYSIGEPWGRPRVVLGVDAYEAEVLAALLDSYSQAGRGTLASSAVVEAVAPEDREPGPGGDPPVADATPPGLAGDDGGRPAQEAEGRPAQEADGRPAQEAARSSPEPAQQDATAARPDGPAEHPGGRDRRHPPADGSGIPARPRSRPGRHPSAPRPASDRRPSRPAAGPDGAAAAPAGAGNEGERDSVVGTGQQPRMTAGQPEPADEPGPARAASETTPRAASETITAELAGWAAGELPGQARARLAAWAAVGGVPAAGYWETGAASAGVS